MQTLHNTEYLVEMLQLIQHHPKSTLGHLILNKEGNMISFIKACKFKVFTQKNTFSNATSISNQPSKS